jgi:VanZ family protein
LKSFIRNFRYWIPVLLWLSIIVYESFGLSSAVTGTWLGKLLQILHIHLSAQAFAKLHHFLRKAGHLTGYGLLCVLLFRSWFHTMDDPAGTKPLIRWSRGTRRFRAMCLRSAALALGMTLLTAALDEWHQTFDPSRTGTPWDVLLDVTGGICFLLIALFALRRWRAEPVEELEKVSV